MSDVEMHDAAVVVTPNDFKRVECNNKRIVKHLPVRKVLFIGSEELGQMVKESGLGEKADLDNLFNNPVYQNKLTARQMIQIAQEESEGYEEVWEEDE